VKEGKLLRGAEGNNRFGPICQGGENHEGELSGKDGGKKGKGGKERVYGGGRPGEPWVCDLFLSKREERGVNIKGSLHTTEGGGKPHQKPPIVPGFLPYTQRDILEKKNACSYRGGGKKKHGG